MVTTRRSTRQRLKKPEASLTEVDSVANPGPEETSDSIVAARGERKQNHQADNRNVDKSVVGGSSASEKERIDDGAKDSAGIQKETQGNIPETNGKSEKGKQTKEKKKNGKGDSGELNSTSSGNRKISQLLPGYKAPLKLSSSSLDRYRPAGGLEELRRRALERDHPALVVAGSNNNNNNKRSILSRQSGFLKSSVGSFKKGTKRPPPSTAGRGWFNMTSTPMTDALKKDLILIKNRNFLDAKRFYKSADTAGKFLQAGTVIEGPSEYYSSRLTKKQRRNNLVDEIMVRKTSRRIFLLSLSLCVCLPDCWHQWRCWNFRAN